MKRLAVLGSPGPDLAGLTEILRGHSDFTTRCFTTLVDVEQNLRGFSPEILVLLFAEFTPLQLTKVYEIARRFVGVSLVVGAQNIDEDARYRFLHKGSSRHAGVDDLQAASRWTEDLRVALIQLPSELPETVETIRRMILSNTKFPRVHVRRRCVDSVQVRSLQGEKSSARMLDISRMGAKLQLSSVQLAPRARLQIEFSSPLDQALHQMEAVVVWVQASLTDRLLGIRTVGVHFIASR